MLYSSLDKTRLFDTLTDVGTSGEFEGSLKALAFFPWIIFLTPHPPGNQLLRGEDFSDLTYDATSSLPP